MSLLAEAEGHLRRAEERVLNDASPDNLRRLAYWRERVKALRAAQADQAREPEGEGRA